MFQLLNCGHGWILDRSKSSCIDCTHGRTNENPEVVKLQACRYYFKNIFRYGQVPQTGRGSVQLVANVSKFDGSEGIFATHHPDIS